MGPTLAPHLLSPRLSWASSSRVVTGLWLETWMRPAPASGPGSLGPDIHTNIVSEATNSAACFSMRTVCFAWPGNKGTKRWVN